MKWYNDWFDDNYLLLYSHRNRSDAAEQVRLIIDNLDISKDTSILDLACGEGRYTDIFYGMGFENIRGIDLSETLVKSGKKKFPHLNLGVGDMRRIPGKYNLILSLFTSFGYFDTDEENEAVIRTVYKALEPGGVYWLDFLNACCVENNLVPETVSQPKPGIEVREARRIENGRIVKDICFQWLGTEGKKQGETCYQESVRLFNRDQLEAMFTRTGFEILECFGDYQGNAWTENSPRTIVVGKKADGLTGEIK